MSLTPGTNLGSYEILAPIGAGGMGEVYRAKDLKLGRDVAIKVLPPQLASDSDRLRRFEQEARSASALNHPNIITIHDIGEHEGTHYIAMEYVEGQTLREILTEGPLPTKKMLRLATQAAEGLAKAHSAGIVHRDLKPENLMVTSDGFVKILDFGLAKLTGPRVEIQTETETKTKVGTQVGTILGTVQYMSPEQASGRSVDYRSDQFSLGLILYEMATGKVAFQRDTGAATLAAIIEGKPEAMAPLDASLPGSFRRTVERCLVKEPEGRYESTSDLAKELEQIREGFTGAPTGVWLRRSAMLAMAGLLATLLVVIGLNVGEIRDRLLGGAGGIQSVAVLPLKNVSGDPEQEYFSDGMTEALISDLAKIGALKVISRTSVMRYKGTEKSLPEIAGELNVDAVLEGSVLLSGERVRITAQLIEAETEQNLWADNYERDLRDILSVQGEVAQAIVHAIQIQLTPEETTRLASARPVNPEAHEAYLKGRFHWYKLTPQDVEVALQYFQLALQKDPDYALAYTGIAEVWSNGAILGVPPGEAIPKAKAAALKAIQLDSTLAEAHDLLARVRTWGEWDWAGAEPEFQRAIELNPNYPDARVFYSLFLTALGRPEEARVQIERALELDPLNFFFEWAFGWHLLRQGRYDDAIVQLRRSLRKEPNFLLAHLHLWSAFHERRMYEEALAEAKAFFAAVGVPDVAEALARGYAQAGYPTAMHLAAETLAARSNLAYVSPERIAELYAYAGDKERALEWLEKAYQDRNIAMVNLRIDPGWDSLRDDPRFQDLLRRMNFPE
jgi:serine/threonine-protein kinase